MKTCGSAHFGLDYGIESMERANHVIHSIAAIVKSNYDQIRTGHKSLLILEINN